LKITNLQRHWYQPKLTLLAALLLPLAWVFRCVVSARRFFYKTHFKKIHRFTAPIIVVGNITVGGTGKTPLVIWLAKFLAENGFKPGIVSRGIGGRKQLTPRWIDSHDDPHEVGDEAILLAKHTQCPVVIGLNRVAAVRELLQHSDCNIVISDDGLQHYAMHRDIEIAVIDGERQLGNRALLPAGPLREPPQRLKQVDFIVHHGQSSSDRMVMKLEGKQLISVENEYIKKSLHDFAHQRVHAVAAIGHPERFFSQLTQCKLQLIEHVFSDHYLFEKNDIDFADELPVIMTEKDAVKCKDFVNGRHWYLPVEAKVDIRLGRELLSKLNLQ
jgi:tetraacyldisaccharide 4'-kinase